MCRSLSSPARRASPASAPACRCRRARCRRRRWPGCAAPADAIALRLRHHDDARCTPPAAPGPRAAKDVYDALEQARVETVGARHMEGVATNLRAKLTEECEAEGYDRMTRRDQLPIAAALSLLARERMSGQPAPAPASRVLDLWREGLGEGAEQALDELGALQGDQDGVHPRGAPAAGRPRPRRGGDRTRRPSRTSDQGDEGGDQQSGDQDDSRRTPKASRRADTESMLGAQPEQMQGDTADEEGAETADEDAAAAEGDDRPGGPQQRRERADAPRPSGAYKAVHPRRRRGDRGRGPVRRRGADPAAPAARPAAPAPARRDLEARQPAAAAPAGAADPRVGVRPRGRHARRRPAVPRDRQPDAGAVLQARARDGLPRHRRHPADRQFRLHARTPDHGGGDVRRHPGAHAGALRGEGGGPRLHDPRLEGRPQPRTLGAGRQAAQPRPPQRPAPHHLQVRRRAVAAGAQESRASCCARGC